MECNERNTMSNLRIIELEQQLKRRDERLQVIEAKITKLLRFDIGYIGDSRYAIEYTEFGEYLSRDSVLEAFK